MNLEYYRNFIEIADLGTLSAASRKLLVAQPALTKQVRNFEDEYGAQLFIRTARRMELTEAGRILYDKAKKMIAIEDSAYKEIDACISGTAGTLSLGLTPSFPDPFIDAVLSDFHSRFPDIEFDIHEDTTPALLRMITDGIAEVGIVRPPGRLPISITEAAAIPEHLLVIGKRGNVWMDPSQETIDLRTLSGVPLSLPRGFAPLITDECLRRGFRPKLFSVSTSRYLTLFWARQGSSLALIPGSDPEKFASDELICRRLRGKAFASSRSLVRSSEKKLSAAAAEFTGYCMQQIGEIK
ncbi:MAG: LysR family transcriptional regulator [Eubacteriaceae bacterium]|jgi:DNA-binding transcriptional LysR family regulator|nr:LysR family transcriptional regulator [Eubacteriaceae bacterium]